MFHWFWPLRLFGGRGLYWFSIIQGLLGWAMNLILQIEKFTFMTLSSEPSEAILWPIWGYFEAVMILNLNYQKRADFGFVSLCKRWWPKITKSGQVSAIFLMASTASMTSEDNSEVDWLKWRSLFCFGFGTISRIQPLAFSEDLKKAYNNNGLETASESIK